MAAINLKLFDEGLDIETDDEFVIVRVRIWEEGVGSFELAELKISHALARKIGVAGVGEAKR